MHAAASATTRASLVAEDKTPKPPDRAASARWGEARPALPGEGGREGLPVDDPWLDEKEELFGELRLFASLDAEARAGLIAAGQVEQRHRNEVIVLEGEPGTSFYLVMRGSVVVTTRPPGAGRDVTLGVLARGGCFGEVALLSGQPRTATVTAAEDAMLVRYDDAQLEPVLARFPRVRKMLEGLVAGRARDTAEKLGL